MDKITYTSNEGKLYFFNFSPWRMMRIRSFFYAKNNKKIICKELNDALAQGLDKSSKIFIYGTATIPYLEKYSQEKNIPMYRIEDAFIRSISLGSGFAKPYSLIIDSKGLYINPNKPCELEDMLNSLQVDKTLLQRARKVRETIVQAKLSKYNYQNHEKISIENINNKKIILIPGQVEDDMSIKYGACGLTSKDLLQKVREKNPSAYILYKIHPDVLSGNRKGLIDKSILLQYVNKIITDISIDSCIEACDEVHTLTSQVGFDALLREKKVITYGMPFYAGWGLTEDIQKNPQRKRVLTIDEFIAVSLIKYPRYISPRTDKFCEIEQTLEEIIELQKKYFNNKLYKFKVDTLSYILPRIRVSVRYILKPLKIKI